MEYNILEFPGLTLRAYPKSIWITFLVSWKLNCGSSF